MTEIEQIVNAVHGALIPSGTSTDWKKKGLELSTRFDVTVPETDTDCILGELSSKIEHLFLLEQQAKTKAVQCALAQETFKWLKRIIENAAKGDHVEYLASQLGNLETKDYLHNGLKSFPYHIVNHAIVLCKQAIANHTFSTAEKRFKKLSRNGGGK